MQTALVSAFSNHAERKATEEDRKNIATEGSARLKAIPR